MLLSDLGTSLTHRSLGFLVCELGTPALVLQSAIARTDWEKEAKHPAGDLSRERSVNASFCQSFIQSAAQLPEASYVQGPRGLLESQESLPP